MNVFWNILLLCRIRESCVSATPDFLFPHFAQVLCRQCPILIFQGYTTSQRSAPGEETFHELFCLNLCGNEKKGSKKKELWQEWRKLLCSTTNPVQYLDYLNSKRKFRSSPGKACSWRRFLWREIMPMQFYFDQSTVSTGPD